MKAGDRPAEGSTRPTWLLVGVGCAAGIMSGLFGIGGGVIMVPPLVMWAKMTQHEAHATSLAAIIPTAAVGALRFGLDGEVHVGAALLVAAGTLVGAPIGVRIMSGVSEGTLKVAFGVFAIVVGSWIAWS